MAVNVVLQPSARSGISARIMMPASKPPYTQYLNSRPIIDLSFDRHNLVDIVGIA